MNRAISRTMLFVCPAGFSQQPSHPLEERRQPVRGLGWGLDGEPPVGATLDPELRQPSPQLASGREPASFGLGNRTDADGARRGCRRGPQVGGGSAPALVGRRYESIGLPFGRGLLFG